MFCWATWGEQDHPLTGAGGQGSPSAPGAGGCAYSRAPASAGAAPGSAPRARGESQNLCWGGTGSITLPEGAAPRCAVGARGESPPSLPPRPALSSLLPSLPACSRSAGAGGSGGAAGRAARPASGGGSRAGGLAVAAPGPRCPGRTAGRLRPSLPWRGGSAPGEAALPVAPLGRRPSRAEQSSAEPSRAAGSGTPRSFAGGAAPRCELRGSAVVLGRGGSAGRKLDGEGGR